MAKVKKACALLAKAKPEWDLAAARASCRAAPSPWRAAALASDATASSQRGG